MSVDTNLKGKNTKSYAAVEPSEGVTVLLNPNLKPVAKALVIGLRKATFGRKLAVIVEPTEGFAASCRL